MIFNPKNYVWTFKQGFSETLQNDLEQGSPFFKLSQVVVLIMSEENIEKRSVQNQKMQE